MIQFGTGGYRGIIGDGFTRETVETIAQALCETATEEKKEKPIVIGYDRRFMSENFAEWAACVFAANGIRVFLYTHETPSPAVMCATRDLGLDYGVMITASHNPAIFNGVKIFLKGGCDADVRFTQKLEEKIAGGMTVRSMPPEEGKRRGLIEQYSNLNEYVAGIERYIDPAVKKNRIKILFDNLHGTGVVGISRLAADLKYHRFDVLRGNREALFGGGLPDPSKERMLALREQTLAGGYDFAMATDSDGDRLGILDEKGNYIDSNDILACLYYYLVKYRGLRGDIVKNCATSVLPDRLAKKFGFACYEVDVGFKNVSAKMLETDALIGGESSGGLTCRGYLPGKDSAFSSALFAEMRILTGKSVSAIVKEVHDFAEYDYAVTERAVRLRDPEEVVSHLLKREPDLGRAVSKKLRFGQNFKYLFGGDMWALLRFSGTEPLLRVFVEAENKAEAERLADCLIDFVRESGGAYPQEN